MQEINLRDLYPDVYKEDMLVKVSEDVLAVITADHRADAAMNGRCTVIRPTTPWTATTALKRRPFRIHLPRRNFWRKSCNARSCMLR